MNKHVNPTNPGGLRALTSALLTRMGFSALAGITFGGARDLYTIFGWNRNPEFKDFLAKYRRQDITQRIINSPVKATWSDPPTVKGGSAFETAWKALVDEHDLFQKLATVDKFAGIGRYAILLVGLDDGRPLSSPIGMGRQNKVLYLQPYMEGSLNVKTFDDNENSPRFSMPLMYEVNPGDIDSVQRNTVANRVSKRRVDVHWSRVLHVADNCLEDNVFGNSRLEPIYNLLDDIQKVVASSAETYWMAGNRGMQIDVDKEMELQADDAEDLSDEVEEYQHGQRRFIRTRGVKINNLGSDVADPKNTFDVQLSMIASATGIPKRVLIGVEAGQLASQQDRANWAVTINERIADFAEPKVLKPCIRMFQSMGVLPAAESQEIDWPDPYKMSPLERAQTSAQMARSMVNATKALATARQEVDMPVWSADEARRVVGFGKHMPVFDGKPEGEIPPKKEPEPAPTGPFGGGPPRG